MDPRGCPRAYYLVVTQAGETRRMHRKAKYWVAHSLARERCQSSHWEAPVDSCTRLAGCGLPGKYGSRTHREFEMHPKSPQNLRCARMPESTPGGNKDDRPSVADKESRFAQKLGSKACRGGISDFGCKNSRPCAARHKRGWQARTTWEKVSRLTGAPDNS